MIVERPRASGVETFRHDHEAGTYPLVVERRISAEIRLERLTQGADREFRHEQPASPELLPKDAGAELVIDALELRHGHAASERRGDDRACRGAADQIEVVAKQELLIATALSQQFLDRREVFERQDAADSAPVEGQDAFRDDAAVQVLVFAQDHDVSLSASSPTGFRSCLAFYRNSNDDRARLADDGFTFARGFDIDYTWLTAEADFAPPSP